MAASLNKEKKKKIPRKIAGISRNIKEEETLKLEDVLDLGGTKEDYQMLEGARSLADGVDSSDEEIEEGTLKDEIKNMVDSLGLDTVILESNSDSESDDGNSASEANSNTTSKQIRDSEPLQQANVPLFEKLKKIIIKPESFWHEPLNSIGNVEEKIKSDNQVVNKFHEVAKRLWENEVDLYQTGKSYEKSSDERWLRTVLSSGTLNDRVAANTMLLQESPLHQMRRLENLLVMAKRKNRREAIMAIDSVRSLWTTTLLPDRKLKYFWQWPLSQTKELSEKLGKHGEAVLLILWYFEDVLKSKCSEFVGALEVLSRDTVPGIRDKTTGTMYELLAAKPEQEQRLLTAIVNKLGDPNRKVASRASYLLGQLVIKHPNMKMTVIQEVERMIYRPNIAAKAQYYAICFLNQLILTKSEHLVASRLISIYFTFFKALAKGDSSETKMLGALLSGVNRAFPFTQDRDEDKYEEQLNMLFKVCHTSNFHTSVQALMLLFQVMESRKTVTDRYYRALYEKLFDLGINTTRKRTMFLNIIYKSMKSDPAINRIKAFFKRLLQVASCEEPNFVCGLLYLLSEVIKLKPGIKGLVMQPEEEDDDEHFQDIDENNFTAPNESEISHRKTEVNVEDRTSNEKRKRGWNFRDQEVKRTEYDISGRNPLFCGAHFSSAWEVHPLLKHYHPSVNRFAESILSDNAITYKGDPLQDFTIMRFLDRFMYKNPKKKAKDHGSSIMQLRKVSERSLEMPVNSKNFTGMKIEKIREDEIFFYRYFKRKEEMDGTKKGKKRELVEDIDVDGAAEIAGSDFDFASEINRSRETEPKRKKKKSKDDDDDDEIDGENESSDDDENDVKDMFDDGDFSLDDLEFCEDEEFADDFDKGEQKRHYTDADYEKVLLENLTDSEIDDDDDGSKNDDDIDGVSYTKNDKRNKKNVSSMFAAADEFAHLLEGSAESKGQRIQEKWESRSMNDMRKQKRKPVKDKRTRMTSSGMRRSHHSKKHKQVKMNENKSRKSKLNRKIKKRK